MVLVVLLLVTAASLSSRAAAVPYEPETAFCKPQRVHDFQAPLKRMPKLRQPSPIGRIGIGPESLRLRPAPSLVFGKGEVGFTLGLAQRKGLSLPWTAVTTFVEVNGNGRPKGKPHRSVKRVGWLEPSYYYGKEFRFEVPGKPAFYRVTVTFRGASDQKLGKFGFYYRVLRSAQRARLRLDAPSYRPGTTVFARVENFGSDSVTYGVAYRIERLEGESWVVAPESPRGPVLLILLYSPPGMSGECSAFGIPGSMPPGHYRMVKEVDYVPWPMRKQSDLTLTAEFDVVP